MTVTINGTKYEIGADELLIVIGNKITIGTTFSGEFKHSDQPITIEGDAVNVSTNRNVNVAGKILGKVDCMGDVNVGGDVYEIDTKGNVTVTGNVTGNIDTMGDVRCGNVGGDIDATGNVYRRK